LGRKEIEEKDNQIRELAATLSQVTRAKVLEEALLTNGESQTEVTDEVQEELTFLKLEN
jgi:hypothetical protein